MEIPLFLKLPIGMVLLLGGAELLVRGATRLATAAGISTLVVGLTVVAYGTSSPELAVTIQSNYAQPPKPDLAIGNIVGSNISNVLLVLGMSAAVAPLRVSRQLFRRSLPLMVGVATLPLLMGLDGQITRIEGLLLFAGALIYTAAAIYQSRREMARLSEERPAEETEATKARTGYLIAGQAAMVIGGLAALLLGANWLVEGAVVVAEAWGVSELVIGLTIVAVGTSLPEMATSVVAAFRGEREIAVGNVVGSNIFNVLLVLGGCALTAPNGVAVSGPALRFDIPVMVAISAACLPIFFTGYCVSRWEGLLFLAYYAAYATYLFLQSTQHDALEAYSNAMLLFVVPLTAMALAGLALRAAHLGK